MTLEKILCLAVGFFMGICFTVIVTVLIADWQDKRSKLK